MSKKKIQSALLGLVISTTSFGAEVPFTAEQSKAFVQKAFADVFDNSSSGEEVYAKYFSKNYRQYVDGQYLDYAGFVEHMAVLKATMSSIHVTFKHIIAEGNQVSTVHVVEGVKKTGEHIEAQVNAFIEIKDGKIVLCDELTHLIKGQHSDRDLGSRR